MRVPLIEGDLQHSPTINQRDETASLGGGVMGIQALDDHAANIECNFVMCKWLKFLRADVREEIAEPIDVNDLALDRVWSHRDRRQDEP